MFGLSWGQIAIIVLVGVFVLGPDRIPTAVSWVMTSLRKVRTMAAGAQAELRREIGPELDELRRQVADLQSLKEIQDLRDLRDLHPKRLIGKNILGDEFSGGITGFLGLSGHGPDSPQAGADPAAVNGLAADGAANGSATNGFGSNGAGSNGEGSNGAGTNGSGSGDVPPHLPPSMTKSLAAPRLVGGATPHAPIKTLAPGESPPFDPDGT
jgi:sec-independent protein translocase protein TatB